MKVICDNCKNEINVSSMYFKDARITATHRAMEFEEDYNASIKGKTICPSYGKLINKILHKKITDNDILWLITGERR